MDVWLKRAWTGGLSILDQGAYSLGNFCAVVLLAGMQNEKEYGAFATAFAVLLFIGGLYNGFVLEPISVLAPSTYSGSEQDYLACQLWIHLVFTLPLAAIFYVGASMVDDALLKLACEAASFALPLTLLTLLARRIYHAIHDPFGAFVCSVIYSAVLVAGLLVISNKLIVSVAGVFTVMSMAGIAGGVTVFWRALRRGLPPRSVISESLRAHWRLGGWIVSGAFFLLLGELAPVVFVSQLRGLQDAGAFKAIQNFIAPMIQILTALTLAGLPALAREFGAANAEGFHRIRTTLLMVMTGLALCYEIMLMIFHPLLPDLLYGGQYREYSGLIPVYGMVPILVGLFSGYFLSLRVIRKPHVYLLSGLIPFLAGAPATYLLTARYGILGAILGIIFSHLIILVVSVWFYTRHGASLPVR